MNCVPIEKYQEDSDGSLAIIIQTNRLNDPAIQLLLMRLLDALLDENFPRESSA